MEDLFETDTTRACCLSGVTVLVRALRVSDTHERQRAVAFKTAQCLCCLLCVRCVCVCPFSVRGVARGLTALALASTPSARERPRFAPRRTPQTHTPQSLCAQDQDPEPLALSSAWKLRSRQQVLPRRPLRQRFLAVTHVTVMVLIPSRAVFLATWWPSTPFRAVFHRDSRLSEAPGHHDLPVQVTSPIFDPDESIIQPGGRKRSCLINTSETEEEK